MKSSTAILIAAVGVILSLCVGILGGAAAGIYVSQLSPRSLSQGLPMPGGSTLPLPSETQPGQSLPNVEQTPSSLSPFRNPNRVFPNGNVAGAVVLQVVTGSPAETGGLQMGGVVTAVNGQIVDANHPLNELIAANKPGDTVALKVTRGTDKLTVNVTLGDNPDNSGAPYLGIRFTMFQTRPSGQSG